MSFLYVSSRVLRFTSLTATLTYRCHCGTRCCRRQRLLHECRRHRRRRRRRMSFVHHRRAHRSLPDGRCRRSDHRHPSPARRHRIPGRRLLQFLGRRGRCEVKRDVGGRVASFLQLAPRFCTRRRRRRRQRHGGDCLLLLLMVAVVARRWDLTAHLIDRRQHRLGKAHHRSGDSGDCS